MWVYLGKGRNKPYGAFVTTGYDDETGKQIQKSVGYFRTREEALSSLELFNMQKKGFIKDGERYINPSNIETKNIKCPTLKEVWQKLQENELSHLSQRSLINYNVSFRTLSNLHHVKSNNIKLIDLQPIFDKLMEAGTGQSKMNNLKIVLNYIFKYGSKYDFINKNYVEFINFRETLDEDSKKKKIPFSKEQIKLLFKNKDNDISKSILIMIYTGMRPSELLQLKKENVFLKDKYMIGGIKTKAGIGRIIPIHDAIFEFVEEFYNKSNCEYLYREGKAYANYLLSYNEFKEQLKLPQTPHCGRHTFATLANEFDLDETLIKTIIGHSKRDLTKDVYTHISVDRLIKEINLIPEIC